MIGTSSAKDALSEPRTVQGGGGTGVKITREWNGERLRQSSSSRIPALRGNERAGESLSTEVVPRSFASSSFEDGAFYFWRKACIRK